MPGPCSVSLIFSQRATVITSSPLSWRYWECCFIFRGAINWRPPVTGDKTRFEVCRSQLAVAVKQFHEEEAIGKTYDFQVGRRLLRYLKPYVKLLIPALILTLVLNLLGTLQPKFTEYAIDWYIVPKKLNGLTLFALVYVGSQF